MPRLFFLATALCLTLSAAAHAGAYSDRLRQNEERRKAEDAQAQAEGNLREQLDLQREVLVFAAKHGGLRDAGECSPSVTGNCTFFAICVPTPHAKLAVAQLGRVKGSRIDRCEVSLGDGSACNLTNDFDALWSARKDDNHIPKLKADCLDARNVGHDSFQY